MPLTHLTLKIPGQDDIALELEPGAALTIEASPPDEPRSDDDPEKESADGPPPKDEPRSAGGWWSTVRGFDALPPMVRDALHYLGTMRRAASLVPARAEMPSGFARLSPDSHIFVLSEPVVGRDGFVLAGPWDLNEYARNPVVLYQHNATSWEAPATNPDDMLPVGRALQVTEPSEGVLISEIVFDLGSERGANLDRLYRQGFLSAVSARWVPESISPAKQLPRENPYYDDSPDIYVMFGNRLIEQSAVVLPGLATATIIEGPERALSAARRNISDPKFRTDLEAVILAAPAHLPQAAAAEASTAPTPRGWWGFPQE